MRNFLLSVGLGFVLALGVGYLLQVGPVPGARVSRDEFEAMVLDKPIGEVKAALGEPHLSNSRGLYYKRATYHEATGLPDLAAVLYVRDGIVVAVDYQAR